MLLKQSSIQNLVLQDLIAAKTKNLQCLEPTKAYIVGVLSEIRKEGKDFSQESLTLAYANAQRLYSFEQFQAIGDWILFAKVMFPSSLTAASPEYYSVLAQESYNRCYRILNRQWVLFEELADRFPEFIASLRSTKWT